MIVENVSFPTGQHCETTTLGALLHHQGLDLSEPMLFGLGEAVTIVDDDKLRLGHQLYAEIAPLWTEVSDQLAAAGETRDPDQLTGASTILTELAHRERHAMQILTDLRPACRAPR
jgi:hypothetical protein